MISELALPRPGWISHADRIGWLATDPANRSATVLDLDLRVVSRVDIPVAAQRFQASVSPRFLAAVTLEELVVCDRLGRILWRHEHVIPRAGSPCEPNCHLDAEEILWVYLPAGDEDELAAYDAATGELVDRTRLESSVGAACFWPHPDRKRLGLHVAMGQDTPLSHLAWLTDGRVQGRVLPGACLNGFTSTGDRYLAMPHGDLPEIAIHDTATGTVIAA